MGQQAKSYLAEKTIGLENNFKSLTKNKNFGFVRKYERQAMCMDYRTNRDGVRMHEDVQSF